MLAISESDIRQRIARDNPWWSADGKDAIREAKMQYRVYFDPFRSLALNFGVTRAPVLLGPRRVGKTVMLKQLVHAAIEQGINPSCIMYVSIDTPIYSGMSLERFLSFFPSTSSGKRRLVIFDEIQYLRDWEVHLKDLVDTVPDTKFIASGSAAAALRLKSNESGAGRFSDFMLPPLTFAEFLQFLGKEDALVAQVRRGAQNWYESADIAALNTLFIDYLNFGGYPEAVLNLEVRSNPDQYIRTDIIEKVLLKDLPSLYGINDIQELNRLFSFLAYNAGNEASLENISQQSGLAKPTIKKYIGYLESAFLIIKLPMVDDNCRKLQRERNFKVYLNNPSMRAALFAPVKSDQPEQIGHLAESAVFSQWQHSQQFKRLRYARWREGEVDVVFLASATERPAWIGEIKWSDRIATHGFEELRALQTLQENHPKSIGDAFFTTRSVVDWEKYNLNGLPVKVVPTALYCYTVSKNIGLHVGQSIMLPTLKSSDENPADLEISDPDEDLADEE